MSRPDCISNRNIKIIAAYTKSKTGSFEPLFQDLAYPTDHYASAEEFFLNEDEWTSFENFETIFRRAKDLVGEPHFYFNCGASSARFGSWGRFHYFLRIFTSPDDGYKRLPFFNKNFNDTKEIIVVQPPYYDPRIRKKKVVLQVIFHDDFDPNRDYLGDPYLRGILSSIPTLWGLPPAWIRQPVNPYDPVRLFNEDPDLIPLRLEAQWEGDILTVRDPGSGKRIDVGKRVLLLPEQINGQSIFLGKYQELGPGAEALGRDGHTGVLITRTLTHGPRILAKKGEIFMAPYSVLVVTYERFSLANRARQALRFRRPARDQEQELMDTIEQLRKSIAEKNQAYRMLQLAHQELSRAKAELDLYARHLEEKVRERTQELQQAQRELILLNQELKGRVERQVEELRRFDELRRYLSPRLAEQILEHGGSLGRQFKRKFMTVVFTDIRGFSNITDSLEAEEIFHLLNGYLTEMVEIIHRHEGTLNKVMGDGLVIFFGDPVEMEDHALRAVRMAVEMQKKVAELQKEWEGFGHKLGVGIGINTGYMTVGSLGSDILKDYTVIGNQVNIAARVEAMAGPGQILITHRTYNQIKDAIEAKEFGEVRVKGFHLPVKVYEVRHW